MVLIFPLLRLGRKPSLVGGEVLVCAQLVETAKQLKAKGVEVVSVIGFANKDTVILEDKLRACGGLRDDDDSSYGIKGYVSTVIDGFDWTQMPCIVAELQVCLNMSTASLKIALMPMFLWKLAWLVVWVLAMPVWFMLGESDAKNLRVCEGPVFPTGKVIV